MPLVLPGWIGRYRGSLRLRCWHPIVAPPNGSYRDVRIACGFRIGTRFSRPLRYRGDAVAHRRGGLSQPPRGGHNLTLGASRAPQPPLPAGPSGKGCRVVTSEVVLTGFRFPVTRQTRMLTHFVIQEAVPIYRKAGFSASLAELCREPLVPQDVVYTVGCL